MICVIDTFELKTMHVSRVLTEYNSFSLSYYRPQTKFAKVMFLHLSVSHSVHGGSVSVHAGIADPPGADIPQEQTPDPPGTDPHGADTPTAQCMLGDTANKRAVHILLECILVKFVSKDGNGFTCMQGCNSTYSAHQLLDGAVTTNKCFSFEV